MINFISLHIVVVPENSSPRAVLKQAERNTTRIFIKKINFIFIF